MTVEERWKKKTEQDGGWFEVGCCPRNLLYMFSSGTLAARHAQHAHVLSIALVTGQHCTASLFAKLFSDISDNPSLIGDLR